MLLLNLDGTNLITLTMSP